MDFSSFCFGCKLTTSWIQGKHLPYCSIVQLDDKLQQQLKSQHLPEHNMKDMAQKNSTVHQILWFSDCNWWHFNDSYIVILNLCWKCLLDLAENSSHFFSDIVLPWLIHLALWLLYTIYSRLIGLQNALKDEDSGVKNRKINAHINKQYNLNK